MPLTVQLAFNQTMMGKWSLREAAAKASPGVPLKAEAGLLSTHAQAAFPVVTCKRTRDQAAISMHTHRLKMAPG